MFECHCCLKSQYSPSLWRSINSCISCSNSKLFTLSRFPLCLRKLSHKTVDANRFRFHIYFSTVFLPCHLTLSYYYLSSSQAYFFLDFTSLIPVRILKLNSSVDLLYFLHAFCMEAAKQAIFTTLHHVGHGGG